MRHESDGSVEPPIVRLRPPGAARYVGLSVSTLAKLRCQPGEGPAFRRLGRAVTYEIADLDAWCATKEKKTSTIDSAPAAQEKLRRMLRERTQHE